MKYKWLNKQNNNKVIVFFNGWGMDEKIVSHLDCEDFDVVVLYDYNDLALDLDFSNYKEKYVIAWSMGVMVATNFDFGEIKSATAICGTPLAIDDEYGIPKRIYNLTIRGFSEASSQKFMERMFIDTPPITTFSNRTFESIKQELSKMLEYTNKDKITFNKQIIANDDKIIPTKNQMNYWKDGKVINSGHCPMFMYKKWSELL